MKTYDVYGLGNGLVDIFIEMSEEDFGRLDLERGTMRLVEVEEQQQLLGKFGATDPILVSGGSVANSVIALTQLGGKGALACTLGDDKYGLHYKSEFDDLGIEIGNPLIVNAATGTVVVIVTPDAERTMRTCLGVASHLSEKHIVEETVARSKWVFIEGYLFSNPDSGQLAIKKSIELAKKNDCRVAITFSESWVVDAFGDALREAVESADLIFANEAEAKSFSGEEDFDKALEVLGKQVSNYVVTKGPDGAWVSFDGTVGKVDAYPCDPVDLTGAGDAFAGTFLYGINHRTDPLTAARAACYISKQVIVRVGARLHSGVQGYWDECLSQ